jgi:hypothetical protein
MLIEDVVGVKIDLEKEVDMEDGNRGWNLEDIAGDSLRQDGGAQDERRKASPIGDPTRSFIEGYKRTLLKPAKNTNVASRWDMLSKWRGRSLCSLYAEKQRAVN